MPTIGQVVRSLPLGDGSSARSQIVLDVLVRVLRARTKLTDLIKARQLPHEVEIAVSDAFGFVYLAMPKVASRSLLWTLADATRSRGGLLVTEGGWAELVRQTPARSAYFTFTFVRNPWHRVVSCYRDKIAGATDLAALHRIARYPGLYQRMTFRQFVEWLSSAAGRDDVSDVHWRSQARILRDQLGASGCDFIARWETLAADLGEIQTRLRLPSAPLVHLNRSHGEDHDRLASGYDYRRYYDRHTHELVAQRYADDITRFGYKFDRVARRRASPVAEPSAIR